MKLHKLLVSCVIFFALSSIPILGQESLKEANVKLSSDGWEIFGTLRIPASGDKVPAVILFHKANGNRGEYEKLTYQLNRKGLATFSVDLRAHGESINKGKFGPPFGADPNMKALLEGSRNDVIAAYEYLRKSPLIDGERIGILSSSYSGDRVAKATRQAKLAKAYVSLSPGDFSDESIEALDSGGVPWLFVRCLDERSFFNDIFQAIREKSKTSQIIELPGKSHATDILETHPEINEIIAVWFEHKLR